MTGTCCICCHGRGRQHTDRLPKCTLTMLEISTTLTQQLCSTATTKDGPSTKDIAHLCKTKGKLGTHVLISSETIVVDKINKTNGRSSTSRVRHLGPLAYEQHMPKEMRTAWLFGRPYRQPSSHLLLLWERTPTSRSSSSTTVRWNTTSILHLDHKQSQKCSAAKRVRRR